MRMMVLQTTVSSLGVINLFLEVHHLLTASFIFPSLFIYFFISSTVIFIVSINYLKLPRPLFIEGYALNYLGFPGEPLQMRQAHMYFYRLVGDTESQKCTGLLLATTVTRDPSLASGRIWLCINTRGFTQYFTLKDAGMSVLIKHWSILEMWKVEQGVPQAF